MTGASWAPGQLLATVEGAQSAELPAALGSPPSRRAAASRGLGAAGPGDQLRSGRAREPLPRLGAAFQLLVQDPPAATPGTRVSDEAAQGGQPAAAQKMFPGESPDLRRTWLEQQVHRFGAKVLRGG